MTQEIVFKFEEVITNIMKKVCAKFGDPISIRRVITEKTDVKMQFLSKFFKIRNLLRFLDKVFNQFS